MSTAVQLTPESFEEKFRDSIRVGLNWDRFFKEEWPVEIVTLSSYSDLGRCYIPWYVGKSGEEVNYDHEEAAPMNLSDVPKVAAILNDERQGDIHQFADSFRNEHGTVQFCAPTYALPDDQYFVLDRNHRLSALTLVSVPFLVTLWNVRGPLDSDCLLDLIHWVPKPS